MGFRKKVSETKIIKMVGMVESSYYRALSCGKEGNKLSFFTRHNTKEFVGQDNCNIVY